MTSTDKAFAQGELKDTPLAHILVYMSRNKLSGTLVIRTQGLGAQLYRLYQQYEPSPQITLEGGLAALDHWLPLFVEKQGTFEFFANENLLPEASKGHPTLDPLALITRSLREWARADVVEPIVKLWSNNYFTLQQVDWHRFAFDPDELEVVAFISQRAVALSELEHSVKLSTDRVHRLIYLMAICRFLQPSTVRTEPPPPLETEMKRQGLPLPRPESTPPRREEDDPLIPDAPADLPFTLRQQWMEIKKTIHIIDQQNYFEMLGVQSQADEETIQRVYFALAKIWHPDRLPKELESLRPHAETLFQHYTDAYQTLMNPTDRERYRKTVEQGGGTPAASRKIRKIIEGAMEYQKAEVLFKRGDFQGAARRVDLALSLNPHEADYFAMRAHIYFQLNTELEQAASLAQRAIRLNPRNVRAHFVLGQILKRHGQIAQALEHFQRVIELEPKHIDALREIRLASLREMPQRERKASLIERIFGKKP